MPRTVIEAVRHLIYSAPGEVVQITLAPLIAEYVANNDLIDDESREQFHKQIRAGIMAEGSMLMNIPMQIDRRLDPCHIEMTCRVVVGP
jgi:hypothetical protein